MLVGYNQKYVPIASRIKGNKSIAYLKQKDMVYRIVLYDYRKRQFLQKIDIPENEDIQMMLNNRNVILRDAQMSIINEATNLSRINAIFKKTIFLVKDRLGYAK
jgi:urease accessory protein UreE